MPKNEKPYPDKIGGIYQEYPWYNKRVSESMDAELAKVTAGYGVEYYKLRGYYKID